MVVVVVVGVACERASLMPMDCKTGYVNGLVKLYVAKIPYVVFM